MQRWCHLCPFSHLWVGKVSCTAPTANDVRANPSTVDQASWQSQAETLQTEEMMLKAMKQEAIMLRAQAKGRASFQTCVRGFGGGISPQPVGQSTARLLEVCETRAAIHQSNVHRLHASGRPDLHDGGGGLRFLLVSPRLSLSPDSLALHGVLP